MRAVTPAALISALLLVFAGSAQAELQVTRFTVTPSTTLAGSHPNLTTAIDFGEATTPLKDLFLHMPPGLTAHPEAFPFCSRKRLLADICPARSRVGSITLVGVAFGLDLTVTRKIYNARPLGAERLRLAVPIYGSLRRPGVAAELPVGFRSDGGMDMAVTGLPSEVNGIQIRIKRFAFTLRGTARVRKGRRWRSKPFLTSPAACGDAVSTLEATSHEPGAATVKRTSAFTVTGCPPGASTAAPG
jgi:hypothetical protein